MAGESLGTGVLNLTVDTRGIEVGIDRAKQKVSGFGNAAQAEYDKMTAAQKRLIDAQVKSIDTMDLDKAARAAYNVTLKTSGALQEELLTRINAVNAAQKKGGTILNEYGLSAKQSAAALRQVPAQMTDIFVSLQGGQNPLTVLLQQGGQLKDVFGGVVPAARALGSAVVGLINPVTLTAAAIVGLVAAINNVEERQFQLAKAIALTGNAADVSSEQLRGYIATIDSTTDASERSATEAVARVTATGKFVGEQILTVATAAQQLEEATGRSVEKTVAEFASLKEGPVDAIQKLNAAIGDGTNVTHFLTEQTLQQIKALRDQGDEAGATRVAIEAYADAIADRAPKVTEELTSIAAVWRSIKSATADAVDATIGGLDSVVKAVHDHMKDPEMVDFMRIMFRLGDGDAPAAAKRRASPPPRGGPSPIVDPEQAKAQKEFEAQGLRFLTESQKLERDLAEARRIATAAGIKDVSVINERLAAIRREYAERAARGSKGAASAARSLANAEVKAGLQDYKDALQVELAGIQQGTQLLQAEYAARNISAEDYYEKQRGFAEQAQSAEETALQGQIALLQQRSLKGKDAVDTARQIGELEAQLAKVRAESATKLAILTIQEQEYYEKRSNAIEDYRDRLMESNAALQIATNAAIARIGMGSQEAEQQERINEIYREQALAVAELQKQLRRKDIDQVTYDEEVRARQEATDEEVRIVQDGYARMLEAQSDWLNGFHKGLADWLAGTANVAEQISGITNRALDSASDALANFALTGKLEIKQLLASILTDIVKFLAQRAIMQFVQAFLPVFGAGAGAASGSNFGIPAPGSGGSNFFLNANGNPFPGGTTLPTNTVLTKPTLFKFAKGGAFGVGGEAGAEAVMPLQRGRDGKLGVRLYGGGQSVNVHVETNVYPGGQTDTQVSTDQQGQLYNEFTDHMRRVAQQTVMDEMRPGGSLHRAGVKA